jgi:hypothetical protein
MWPAPPLFSSVPGGLIDSQCFANEGKFPGWELESFLGFEK